MARDPEAERIYQETLDILRTLAQQDLADWWEDTDGLDYPLRDESMLEAFNYVQSAYGEQAAYAAADYLFVQRSRDEALMDLEYPEVAAPASFAQAKGSYRWATSQWRIYQDDASLAAAKRRLSGVLNRLVAQPAHETVSSATLEAGTGFARVPEPGACDFCLMLASRGAAYTRESVGRSKRFHDNCRCLGIEVKTPSDLPRINRELGDLWEASGSEPEFFGALKARRSDAWPRRIINKSKAKVKDHERVTFETLARAGRRVEIRAPSNVEGEKSADVYLDGILTEIKAPTGNGKETVKQLVREGRKQAGNVIIDLHRSPMSNEEALRQIDEALARYDGVNSVLLITHEGEFVERRGNG